MAQSVEQFERSGHVVRRPNPNDRRSHLVFLTRRGTRIPPITHKATLAIEKRWEGLIGAAELKELRASLIDLLSE